MNAMATIGAIRASADNVQTQIGNLEDDSFSGDSGLNSEVSVLNKINAAGVLTLHTVQDSNKLLAALLEQQTILMRNNSATRQRVPSTSISTAAKQAWARTWPRSPEPSPIHFRTSACSRRARAETPGVEGS